MYETQIAAGMALLDEQDPGWRESIDTATLTLRDGCDCVLGQRYGVFGDGLTALGITHYDMSAYGFSLPPLHIEDIDEWVQQRDAQWEQLTAEWRQALAQPGGGDG